MLVGGWGRRAGELLEAGAARRGEELGRSGSTVVLGGEASVAGEWRCWFRGRLSDEAELQRRFPKSVKGDPAALVACALAQRGPAVHDLLHGTFLLVAVEAQRDVALVSRDHLGGRPLVYSRVGDGVLFAEHECDILDLLPDLPSPDRLALQQWVDTGMIPPDHTLYEGIYRLGPGRRLALSSDGVAVERYWAPRFDEPISGTRHEVGERLREEAFAAVARVAAGSSRISLRLSGGLDSACVAAGLAARADSSEALALSMVFPRHPKTDERPLLEETARHTKLPLEELVFDDRSSILGPALRHVGRWRLPPVTPNIFIWEPVMERARELGIDAMLDGEGGDELFGIAPQLIADALRSGRLPLAWSLAGRIPGVGEGAGPRVRLRALRIFGTGPLAPSAIRRRRARRAAASFDGSLLTRGDRVALADLFRDPAAHLDGPHWWRSLAAELTGAGESFDVAGHLRREAIAGGIDRRHPFAFDRDLVTGVLLNPPQMQFDPVRDRALLRDALAGYIPEAIRGRFAKSFFTSVLRGSLQGQEGDVLATLLASPDAPVRAFLDVGALDRMLERRAVGESYSPFHLWRAGMADIWLTAGGRPEHLDEVLEKAI